MVFQKDAKQIGEFTYEVTQLGAKVGNRVLMKMAKSVGPMFLLAAAGGSLKLDARAAARALQDLNEEDFDWVIQQLASKTDVHMSEGKAPALTTIFDVHFAGRYDAEFEWLEFAIEVNFGPFFRGLRQKAAAAAAKAAANGTPAPSNSTSPSTSTGESSAS